MTSRRADNVVIALDQLLPEVSSWQENCTPEFRRAFPSGVLPHFQFSTTMVVCTDQIITAGESFVGDDDFEAFLDALVEVTFAAGPALIIGESTADVLDLLHDVQPVNTMVLEQAAEAMKLPLSEFLGLTQPNSGPAGHSQ